MMAEKLKPNKKKMKLCCVGENKSGRKEKNGKNSGPIILLQADRLNGDQLNADARAQIIKTITITTTK